MNFELFFSKYSTLSISRTVKGLGKKIGLEIVRLNKSSSYQNLILWVLLLILLKDSSKKVQISGQIASRSLFCFR